MQYLSAKWGGGVKLGFGMSFITNLMIFDLWDHGRPKEKIYLRLTLPNEFYIKSLNYLVAFVEF